MPFILLGFLIAKNMNSLIIIKKNTLIIVAIGGALFQFIEYYLFKQSLDFYIGTIFYSVSLFILAIKNPFKKYNFIINYIGEKLSMFIYIIHMTIIIFLSRICSTYSISPNLKPILAVLLSILVAQVYIKLRELIVSSTIVPKDANSKYNIN
jgi:hypothetical protein